MKVAGPVDGPEKGTTIARFVTILSRKQAFTAVHLVFN
jgi:hypothetical protein